MARRPICSSCTTPLTDGLGGVQLLSLLQSRTREHTPDKPVARSAEGLTDRVPTTWRSTPSTIKCGPCRRRRRSWCLPGSRRSRIRAAPPTPPCVLSRPRGARPSQQPRGPRSSRAARVRPGASGCSNAVGRPQGRGQGGLRLGQRRLYRRAPGRDADLPRAARPLPAVAAHGDAGQPAPRRRPDGRQQVGRARCSLGPMGITDPAERIAVLRGSCSPCGSSRPWTPFSFLAPIANLLPSGSGQPP